MSDWTERANCRDWPNPDEFHQPRGVGTQQMRALCNACEVNVTCLDWAIRHETWGYWAGTTEAQRDEFRRRKKIPLEPISDWVPTSARPPRPECGTVAAAKEHAANGEPVDEMCSRAVRDAERKRRNHRDAKENRETA
jgi:WhiB family redox-sensing transcriptional regulator